MAWLYFFGMFISWGTILALGEYAVPDGILDTILCEKKLCLLVLICGAMSAIGVQINLIAIEKLGLIFVTPISSFCSICIATVISSFFGKLPASITIYEIAAAVTVLLLASILCDLARRLHYYEENPKLSEKGHQNSDRRYLLLMLIGLFLFSPALSFASSYATKTDLNSSGIPSLLVVGLISIGAFVGSFFTSFIRLLKRKQLRYLFIPPKAKYALYALWSSIGHFGGNIFIAIASPFLSIAVTWPMANSFYVWSYVWGIATGEFRNAGKKAWLIMILGIVMFVTSIAMLVVFSL